MKRGKRTPGKVLAVALVCGFLFTLAAPPVPATPVQDKRAELERIKNEVQTLDGRLEAVVEQYNYTNIKADEIRRAISGNETRLSQLRDELDFRKDVLGSRLRELYKQGGSNMVEVLTECSTVDDLVSNVNMIQRVGSQDAASISNVLNTETELKSQAGQLASNKAELDSCLASLNAQKSQIESELARRKQMVAGVESDINSLIAQEEAARAPRSVPTSRRPVSYTPPPPPDANAPRVVQIAYQQLGKPYVYAGSGPNVFDCSGLVMYCYAQIGIRLPHSSYAQINFGRRVAYEDLMPGDLVFFHGNGHVGMYVGGGQYIHAPRTGDVVRVADLGRRRDFSGACRIL